MDATPVPISPNDLYRRFGTAVAPLLFDVRRADAFRADEPIVGAVPCPPAGAGRLRKCLLHCAKFRRRAALRNFLPPRRSTTKLTVRA
jgi:hypothetical protein